MQTEIPVNATRHPMDYDALEKGDTIPAEEVERMVGIGRDDDPTGFQLAMMQLISTIERELYHRGRNWTVIQSKGAIRILTDQEAAKYQPGRHERLFRASLRTQHKMGGVDVEHLTDDEQLRFRNDVIRMSRMNQAAMTERKECRMIVHESKRVGRLGDDVAKRQAGREAGGYGKDVPFGVPGGISEPLQKGTTHDSVCNG